jgi:DNA-binding GntR family transcriptional regulator
VPADHASRLRPLAAESLVELAYGSIRESIIAGRFAMGEHLVESRIAEELEISRGPVREALRRLGQEGLVEERPRRGTFVREISADDFVDIYNVRIAIETAAVRLVTARRPDLAPVEETIRRLGGAARRRQVAKAVEFEFRIHEQLCELSENGYLLGVFRSLAGPVRMALALDDAAYEQLEDLVPEHEVLIDAIRSGDGERAATALREHIVSTVGPVLARLGGDAGRLLGTQHLR